MPTPEPVSRRAALTGLGLLGLAVPLAGCTPDARSPASPPPTPTGTAADPTGTTAPEVEPDVALAATVLGVEEAMLARVLATQRRHPRLAGPLADARAAHRAHVDLLTRAVPAGVRRPARRRTPPVPASQLVALTALARAETRLAGTGRRSALAARSGAFARVLGSMAAAASQQAVRVGDAAGERG